MVVQSLWHQSEYLHEHNNETQGMNSVQSVVQALDRLPDFDNNLTLLDELRERQRRWLCGTKTRVNTSCHGGY